MPLGKCRKRAPARAGAVDGRTNRIASLSSTPGGTPVSMRCSRPNRRRTGPSGIVRVEGNPRLSEQLAVWNGHWGG